MCSWERFCAFAREPERRTVAGDATVSIEGAAYEVEPELAGETVTLLWAFSTKSCSSSMTANGSGRSSCRAARCRCTVTASTRRDAPRSGSTRWCGWPTSSGCRARPSRVAIVHYRRCRCRPGGSRCGRRRSPEPVVEAAYATPLAARAALVEQLRRPLGSLPEADRAFIDLLLSETLVKAVIADRVRERLQSKRKEG